MDEIGIFYDVSDPDDVTAREGWHVNLRWNGGDDEPPSDIPGMEVIWRSDGGEPLPEWWTRIIA